VEPGARFVTKPIVAISTKRGDCTLASRVLAGTEGETASRRGTARPQAGGAVG
jgi:hypothetical protein